MSTPFTIGVAATNQTPLDWAGNLRRILDVVRAAVDQGCDLVLLHELCITGYGCEDAFLMPDVWTRAWDMLCGIAARTPTSMIAVLGLPIYHEGALYNCAAVVADRGVAALVPKRHLAGDGLHYEPRWFKPWPAGVRLQGGSSYISGATPIGDYVIDDNGVRTGIEICEDAWGPARAARSADIILNLSASHFAFGKYTVRERLVVDSSRAFACVYAYANALGNEAGCAIYDGDCLIAVSGEVIARSPRFSARDHELTVATVDLDTVRGRKAARASFAPQVEAQDGAIYVHRSRCAQPNAITGPLVTESGPFWTRNNEFWFAARLGLADYVRKAGAQGYVVSLSGGADSACCAQLVADAFTEVDELYAGGEQSREVPERLTCIWQGTVNNGLGTFDAACAVARGLGASFRDVSINALLETALRTDVLGRRLGTAGTDDVPYQNLQARLRAPLPWLIANVENKILLTTSNRSEAAVGYCTMDGDTAGALAPIAGVDKPFVLDWLHWRAAQGSADHLQAVLALKPSAELRSSDADAGTQTDEADLMPYAVLDICQRALVCDRLGPLDVWVRLCARHPEVRAGDAAKWVEKFFRLFARNQWKRARLAVALHYDDHNLDPKSAFRFPVLSGGFEAELTELRGWIARDDAVRPTVSSP